MKNKIIVEKSPDTNEIKFYLKNKNGTFWLFTQDYTKGVYDYFRFGRSEKEVLNFPDWERNKRLSKTISRIPKEVRYVDKYIISEVA